MFDRRFRHFLMQKKKTKNHDFSETTSVLKKFVSRDAHRAFFPVPAEKLRFFRMRFFPVRPGIFRAVAVEKFQEIFGAYSGFLRLSS